MTPDAPIAERLIFLFSLPRSGSTLLQTLLARNREIFSESESRILIPPLVGYMDTSAELHHNSAAAMFSQLRALTDRTQRGRATFFDAVRAYAGELYAARLRETDKRFFLDKTPPYFLIVDEVVATFPDAKFIILLRNPVWIMASYAESWHNGDLMKLLSHPKSMNVLAGPKRLVESIRRLEGRCVVLCYEDLVAEPERELRRVCDYLGVEFDQSMLTYSGGALGDYDGDKKLLQHDRPVQTSLPLPRRLGTQVGARFGLRYMKRLGRETFEAMGYDYEATRRQLLGQKRPFPLSLLGDALYVLAWTKLLLWSIPRHYFAPRFKRELVAFRSAWRGELPPHYADEMSAERRDDLAAEELDRVLD